MDIQTLYQQAIRFAAAKHQEGQQTIPGTHLPYVVHLSNVAMEVLIAYQSAADFDLAFAVQAALLHDVLEDTTATIEELTTGFGMEIATAVAALTKNDRLPKAEKMADSLARIKKLRKEAGAVKLADRITNLQAPPPHWDSAKKSAYHQEAQQILDSLRGSNAFLEARLAYKIQEYKVHLL